jgi:hypothetical protein
MSNKSLVWEIQKPVLNDNWGRAAAQVVCSRFLASDVRFQSQRSPCTGTRTGFSPTTSIFPRYLLFHQYPISSISVIRSWYNRPIEDTISKGSVSPHFCNQKKNVTAMWIEFVQYMVQWRALVATVMDFVFHTDMKCLGQMNKSSSVVGKGPVPDNMLYFPGRASTDCKCVIELSVLALYIGCTCS